MDNRFYKINEVRQHKYYQIPKELYENPKYKTTINNDAKVLYTFLLDRMELSRTNEWVDDEGTIFLIYKREDLADMLGICVTIVCKAFKQLKRVGLIAEKRQGLCKPNIIYIGKIECENNTPKKQDDFFVPAECENIDNKTNKISNSEVLNFNIPDTQKLTPNNTEISITDIIKTKRNKTESKYINTEERNISFNDSG